MVIGVQFSAVEQPLGGDGVIDVLSAPPRRRFLADQRADVAAHADAAVGIAHIQGAVAIVGHTETLQRLL
ncbi:hypothetical protein D3C85_1526210 [compost metagenome]